MEDMTRYCSEVVPLEEGYVRQGRVEYAAGIQKMLMHAVLVAIFSFGIAAVLIIIFLILNR